MEYKKIKFISQMVGKLWPFKLSILFLEIVTPTTLTTFYWVSSGNLTENVFKYSKHKNYPFKTSVSGNSRTNSPHSRYLATIHQISFLVTVSEFSDILS